jgi:protoporphyrinogen oxidase
VHDPGVRVARITNFANWNAELSPPETTVLGLEYFCRGTGRGGGGGTEGEGDDLWRMDDAALLALASRELFEIGLAADAVPKDGRVHRFIDAYPVYDGAYREHRETLKQWVNATFTNVHPAGRKGLHNYNSQDHAMMTATLGVRNATEGTRFDPWSVNTEAEYAEEGEGKAEIEERLVPRRLDG